MDNLVSSIEPIIVQTYGVRIFDVLAKINFAHFKYRSLKLSIEN